MNTIEIEGARNVAKGKLKQKFALLTNDDQLFDESKNELRLGRLQMSLGQTKEELYRRQKAAPAQWFNDWSVGGGEKIRIEAYRSDAKNKKCNPLKVAAFLFL